MEFEKRRLKTQGQKARGTFLPEDMMVIELSRVQFGLKSYVWFQNRIGTQRVFDLKSQVQSKLSLRPLS